MEIRSIKDVPGYFIDDLGNVYNDRGYKLTNTICKLNICVVVTKNNKHYRLRIDKLLAKAFIPNPDNYQYVAHKNGDTFDNRLENLYWSEYKPFVDRSRIIAFEQFDENRNYISSKSTDYLRNLYDIEALKKAARTNTLYKGYYWKAIKDISELTTELSEDLCDSQYEKSIDIMLLHDCLVKAMKRKLNKQEFNVINLKFFDGYSSAEIAKILKLTRSRINQIEISALNKLKSSNDIITLY